MYRQRYDGLLNGVPGHTGKKVPRRRDPDNLKNSSVELASMFFKSAYFILDVSVSIYAGICQWCERIDFKRS